MVTATEERARLKWVALSWEVWRRLKIAAAQQDVSIRQLAERAILKELDGKPKRP